MLQSISSVFVAYRRKTLTGSPDPTHANGTNKPCMCLSSGHHRINVSAVAISIYIYSVYIYILFISKRVVGHYGELISVKIQ